MEYCIRCVMPNTKPGVFLDERGLCNACRSQEMKRKVDWVSRRKELDAIIDSKKFNHIILIDDAREFIGKGDYPTIDKLTEYIKNKNEQYDVEIKDDIIRYVI